MSDLSKLPAHVRRKLEAQHGSLSSSSKGTEKKEKKADRKEKRDDARLHPRPYARALPTRRSPWTEEQWTREVGCFAAGIRCDVHRGLLRLRGLLEAPGAPKAMITAEMARLASIESLMNTDMNKEALAWADRATQVMEHLATLDDDEAQKERTRLEKALRDVAGWVCAEGGEGVSNATDL